ncbi:uncharacterized protein KQ657_000702 [Scheffersomyces spartinae]|uniref:Protein arginine methyltransferase NDUFAF7 n=1 Tax=Scheffersomyces spartinae TaxID=45513 RepID=A0A9P7V9D9_9ASCO|nr:uncharacterized protein KQ657_000702 [Scheffersomyces spartinae]KAG7193629.1 hypothetical protein KQ657_000702 [Scheffersomyces spartinae]
MLGRARTTKLSYGIRLLSGSLRGFNKGIPKTAPPSQEVKRGDNDQTNQNVEQNKSNHPSIAENGLYFGQFTENEYQEAAKIVRDQISKLEKDIKGDFNIRENIGKHPVIPAIPNKSQKPTKVNSLEDFFTQVIQTTGPMSLSSFMRQCLTHPEFGYYTTRDPLASKGGDFITSPEISSVFGEMIGLFWLYTTWVSQGMPENIRIIEFGPGKGTLIYDVMQTFNSLVTRQGGKVAVEIVMIEASDILRNEQYQKLCKGEPIEKINETTVLSRTIWGNRITWYLTETEIEPSENVGNYILAHEFFDALPIKAFKKTENGWREFLVDHKAIAQSLESQTSKSNDNDLHTLQTQSGTDFYLTLTPSETPSSKIPQLSSRFNSLPIGSTVEICPDAETYLKKMIKLIETSGINVGSILAIDYGPSNSIPDVTLRGIYKHKFVSPFYQPGHVDLSVDVDFKNLALIADHSDTMTAYGPEEQGDWLHNVGIGHRIDQLLKKNQNDPEFQDKIYNSYLRLTSKDDSAMGKVYKFLCINPKSSPPPIGYTK